MIRKGNFLACRYLVLILDPLTQAKGRQNHAAIADILSLFRLTRMGWHVRLRCSPTPNDRRLLSKRRPHSSTSSPKGVSYGPRNKLV